MSGARPIVAALALSVVGFGCRDATGSLTPEPSSAGQQHYLDYGCGSCHGVEGRGDGPVAVSLDPKPRDFRDLAGYKQGRSAAAIADTLRIGIRSGDQISAMPAYSHLAEEERLAIAAWIVSLQPDAAAASRPRGLRGEDGWVRAVPKTAPNSAAYVRLTNDSSAPISVVGARSDAAKSVEIHESTAKDGVVGMRPLARIDVAPGAGVELEPGGAHIMLIGLAKPLSEGGQVSLTLELADGGSLDLDLPVRRQ